MNSKAIPFLRWAGSKKNLLPHIIKHIPIKYENYFEPFLGSGAVFFVLDKSDNCFLSDSNEELINVYLQVKTNVAEIIDILQHYKIDSESYYSIRSLKPKTEAEAAARFIYLNKTCYNGLYRVNSNGDFNVPYGKRSNVDVVTRDLLLNTSTHLQNINISHLDFQETLPLINAGDFVFLDPPYVVSHNNNGFIEYNKNIFSWEDQIRLHDFVKFIDSIGAYFVLTNAAHDCIRDLYRDICEPLIMERFSSIGGKNSYRGIVSEFMFTNTHRAL